MSMQEKNNRFQREKHSLQIENKRLQEEIERVSSPLGRYIRTYVCAGIRANLCLEEALGQPVLEFYKTCSKHLGD